MVDAPRDGVPAADVVAAAGAAEVEDTAGASLFAVLPSVKRGVEDEAGAVVVAGVVSAVDLLKLANRFVAGLAVSGAAAIDVVLVWPLAREPNKFDAGADVAGVEEVAPKMDEVDGALMVVVAPGCNAAVCEDVGVADVKEKLGVDCGALDDGAVLNKVVGPAGLLAMLPKFNPDAVDVVTGVDD